MSTPGGPSTSASPTTPIASKTTEQSAQTYACVLCSQRKIKCDRLQPCARCVKSRAECVYRTPDPPKRRKRKALEDEEELRAKLHEYERLLTQAGIDVKSVAPSSEKVPSSRITNDILEEVARPKPTVRIGGSLFVDGSKIKYHENSLFRIVESEFQQHSDVFDEEEPPEEESSSSLAPPPGAQDPTSFLFASVPKAQDLRQLLPKPEDARRMWFTFKDRVDPLLKIFHTSHKEERFLAVIDSLDTQSWSMQSWIVATCLLAIVASTDEECVADFGEPKASIFGRLKFATQQTLIGAGLLRSSDTIVLQAYVMFLLSVTRDYDAGTHWTMTGIAIRIAQRGGLHRDQSSIGKDDWPWHSEMRRRLWWQIIQIDMRASELTGFGRFLPTVNWDTRFPLNINDSDLDVHMTELPSEREGATDMMYCLLGYEMGNFFREIRTTPSISLALQSFQHPTHSAEEKDKVVDELERRIEQKYLRYCDPLVPLHHLCLINARSAIVTSRLIIHYPRGDSTEEGTEIPLDRRNRLFEAALKVIEYQNLVYENPNTRKFAWSMHIRFPWHALIFLLSELRQRPGDDTYRAWELVKQFVDYNPDLLKNNRKVLHIACGSLAIKAWDARVKQLQMWGHMPPEEPEFIAQFRTNRNKVSTAVQKRPVGDPQLRDNAGNSVLPAEDTGPAITAGMNTLDPVLATASNGIFDFDPMNWSQWDDLIRQDFDLAQGVPEMADLFA